MASSRRRPHSHEAPLSPIEETVQVVPTRTRRDHDASIGSEEGSEPAPTSSYRLNKDRGSRPSNRQVVINQTQLQSLANTCLVINDLKGIITPLYNMKGLDFPGKFKTVKSGSWNIKKSGLIGRILLTPEGRELLLWEIKNSEKNQNEKLVTMDVELKDLQFIAGETGTIYRGDVAPSPQLWEDLLFSYGDIDENGNLTTRNPDFDEAWFENYFRATNRDRSQVEVVIDKPMQNTFDALHSAISKDLHNPNEISRDREVQVENILNLIAQLNTESLAFVRDVIIAEIEKAKLAAEQEEDEEYV